MMGPWKIGKLKSKRDGFTLLEVIIALAIMMMAFAAILSSISNSIQAAERTQRLIIVAMLAKRQMVETEYKIEGKTFDEIKKEDGGAFASPYTEYRWTSEVKEIEFPNIGGGQDKNPGTNSESNGAGQNSEIGDMMTKLVTQFLSKAVREVDVTIFWKSGSKEQSYSVSTYWTDLNHEFQLTE